MAKDRTEHINNLHTGLTITLAIIAALLLLVANSAFWFNKYIFDQNNFTPLVTTAVQQESSRRAIANEVTGKLLANRPVLARVAEEPTTNIITGALGSNLAQKVFGRAVDSLHTIATSPNPQDVTLDLTTFKQIATNIAALFAQQTGEQAVNVQDVPDSITIINADKVPNIYSMGVVLLWAGPIALIAAIALLAYPLWAVRRVWHDEAEVLLIDGLAIIAVGILALLIGPLFRPLVLANVQSSNMQTVAGNIYNAFINTFDQQTVWLFVIGGILLLIAIIIWLAKPVSNWFRKRTAKPA